MMRVRLILTLFTLLFIYGFSLSQDFTKILQEKIDRLPAGPQQVDLMVQLGKALQAEKPRQSIQTFDDALKLARSISYENGVTQAFYGLSITYFTSSRADKAIQTLEERLEYLRKTNNTNSLLDYYLLLAKIHGEEKNLIELRKYQNLSTSLQDRLVQVETEKKIATIEDKFQEVNAKVVQQKNQALADLQEQEAISLRRQLEISHLQTQTAELEKANAEKEQARLASENEAIQLEFSLNKKLQNRNRLIVIAGILLLLAGVIIQRFRIIQQRKLVDFEQQKSQKLLQIDRLKDQFLANTSHELRTPLHGIIGIAESLHDGLFHDDVKQRKGNLGMIISAGKRLNNLVNDLLDFSKMRNDDLRLHLKPVDIRAVVDVVMQINGSLASAKGIVLVNEIPPDVPVQADEDRLQQILFNLIDNAIKFSREGVIVATAEERSGCLEISIQDQGIGIASDRQHAIFEEFMQLDGDAERQQSGTGLGLSVTRKLVELHEGTISVLSTEGAGSRFIFTMPISTDQLPQENLKAKNFDTLVSLKDPSGPISEDDTEPLIDQNKIKILIVDDEPINQQVLENHLSKQHYEISSAMDGAGALKLIENGNSFDLVLLDIMMPHMTGYTVCQQIRKKYLASELPIIMITAKNQVSDLVEALAYGANDYLAKPFSKDEFLARIKTHLDLYSINSATTRFVPSEFLRALGYGTITDVRLGDHQEKDVTVFFSDIRAYTTMSETMTPEQNFKFVGAYVNRMGPIIKRFEGFVLQYLGDGIMALFLESADKAINAAIVMQTAIRRYNNGRTQRGRVPIVVGMGLHSGPLVMGIIGDTHRNDPATISDAVNVASRMEGLTTLFGAKILVTKATMERLEEPQHFDYRYLGKVLTKGKKEYVEIFEILGGESDERKAQKLQTKVQIEQGVKAYLENEYNLAIVKFNEVLDIDPDDEAAKYYLQKASAALNVMV
ncbi:MAG: response regulator [Saprospiraceae bacterium]|nr:response regulator [Saprospiraceae bacterium]